MSSKEKIKPLRLIEEHCGKLISVSKRRYTWDFEHMDHIHTLVLQMSLLSRKFSINLDSKLVFKGTRSLFRPFQFESSIHGLRVIIAEKLYSYDLYINNRRLVFVHEIRIRDIDVGREEKNNSRLNTLTEINQDQPKEKSGSTKRKSNKTLSRLSHSKDSEDYLRVDSPIRESKMLKPPEAREKNFIRFRRFTDDPVIHHQIKNLSPKDTIKRHHYSLPTKSEIAQFKCIDKLPISRITGKAKQQSYDQPDWKLAVRRINVRQVSEYEVKKESYETIDFSVATPETKNLCSLLYFS